MKKQVIIITMVMGVLSFGCKIANQGTIGEDTINLTIKQLVEKYGEQDKVRMEKGVTQMAMLWESKDGTKAEFTQYCLDNYIADPAVRERVFERLCRQFEAVFGGFNKMMVSLLEPVHVVNFEVLPIDEVLGAWNPMGLSVLSMIAVGSKRFSSLTEATTIFLAKQYRRHRAGCCAPLPHPPHLTTCCHISTPGAL